MARMADKVASTRIRKMALNDASAVRTRAIQARLKGERGENEHSPVVVDITNVARYWSDSMRGRFLDREDLPRAAPPWTYAFYEYSPGHTFLDEYIQGGLLGGVSRIGIFAWAIDGHSEDVAIRAMYDTVAFEAGFSKAATDLHWVNEPRWMVSVDLMIDGHRGVMGPLAAGVIPVSADGSMAQILVTGDALRGEKASRISITKAKCCLRYSWLTFATTMRDTRGAASTCRQRNSSTTRKSPEPYLWPPCSPCCSQTRSVPAPMWR